MSILPTLLAPIVSHWQLRSFAKSFVLFNSFEKNVSLWSEQHKRELDSWDTFVKETINSLQPPYFLRETDQRFPQGNHLALTTVAKSETLPTRYSQDKTSASSEKARYKPLPSLHLYSSWSENGETSDKGTWKEKKRKQHYRNTKQDEKECYLRQQCRRV